MSGIDLEVTETNRLGGSITLQWNTSGLSLTSCNISENNTALVTGATSPATVSGLLASTAYTFRIVGFVTGGAVLVSNAVGFEYATTEQLGALTKYPYGNAFIAPYVKKIPLPPNGKPSTGP